MGRKGSIRSLFTVSSPVRHCLYFLLRMRLISTLTYTIQSFNRPIDPFVNCSSKQSTSWSRNQSTNEPIRSFEKPSSQSMDICNSQARQVHREAQADIVYTSNHGVPYSCSSHSPPLAQAIQRQEGGGVVERWPCTRIIFRSGT